MKRWQLWKRRWSKANGAVTSEPERRDIEHRMDRANQRLAWLEYEVELRRKRR